MKKVILIASLLAMVAAPVLASTYRTTPTYGGGFRTYGSDGTYLRTTPTYGGGSRTTGTLNGQSVNCRTTTTYGGGTRTVCY